jgi:hypothetical protein
MNPFPQLQRRHGQLALAACIALAGCAREKHDLLQILAPMKTDIVTK